MDYEKAYRDALKRAEAMIQIATNKDEAIDFKNTIFPELKESESESERIRKYLIDFVEQYGDNYYGQTAKASAIAWLEKQGEQKPVDKVEPKFKVGDWVVYNDTNVYQVKEIDYTNIIPRYELENIDRDKLSIPFTSDYNLRNWTIEDAKDGDVLAIGNEYFLFKEKKENTSPAIYISHCFSNSAGAFRVTNGRDCGEFLSIENGIKACPATKEQYDLLFSKMKEAGYEWDADKKVLVMMGIDNDYEQYEKEKQQFVDLACESFCDNCRQQDDCRLTECLDLYGFKEKLIKKLQL